MIKGKVLILLLAFLIVGCRKEKPYVPPSDPYKAILGKWEAIQMGNFPNMFDIPKNGDYIEYKADSVLLEFSANGESAQLKYWFDSLYHEGVFIAGIPPPILDFRYKFYEDKLRLDLLAYFQFNTFIYQRKK